MHILIVKTSSLGDIIHTMPAVTELVNEYPSSTIHWVAESAFAEVPKWHPAVKKVIPVSLRRWRKSPFSATTQIEWSQYKKELRSYPYDLVIDAQGLMKSAFVARYAHGKKYGLDWHSAWEPLASLFYNVKLSVDPSLHAIDRMRQLLAKALDYAPDTGLPDYGLDKQQFKPTITLPTKPFILFCHGTTWITKCWPEKYWIELAHYCEKFNIPVLLPWGNAQEHERAKRIASQVSGAEVLPKLSLTEVTAVLAHASAAVAVDTGLAHISAALSVPTISLYGPTNPQETGAVGKQQVHLAANLSCSPCKSEVCQNKSMTDVTPPCFSTIKPERVWVELQKMWQGV